MRCNKMFLPFIFLLSLRPTLPTVSNGGPGAHSLPAPQLCYCIYPQDSLCPELTEICPHRISCKNSKISKKSI
ncbi:hypothetical protein XENTR_v10017539 [Xenopus tropicalis]|nr:hypothetical protein XENTR_v10017539 [Xenopus tropicalis]